jgi:hypothetical protein
MASAWDAPGATLPKIVIARSRSLRVMACSVGCCSIFTRSESRVIDPVAPRT